MLPFFNLLYFWQYINVFVLPLTVGKAPAALSVRRGRFINGGKTFFFAKSAGCACVKVAARMLVYGWRCGCVLV